MTFQYLVMIKSSQQTRNRKETPLPNKGCLQKLTANILMTKCRILSLRDIEYSKDVLSYQSCLILYQKSYESKSEIKRIFKIQIGIDERKLALFIDKILSMQKILKIYKIPPRNSLTSSQNTRIYYVLHISNHQFELKIIKTLPFIKVPKKLKSQEHIQQNM